MSIVAGVAVDKGTKDQFQITVEIVQITPGKQSKMASKIITGEGKSMFDAARNIIALNGKRLYWSHTKVIIVSHQIASEDLTKVIDWYNRDTETREDVYMLISQRNSAKEIFNELNYTEQIKSFALNEMIQNQKSLSKAPITDIMKFDIESTAKGISAVIPLVNIGETNGKAVPQVMGAAIIKKDKMVGFLNPEETQALLFIRNEVKGGILNVETQESEASKVVSLEIFKNKTKIKPVIDGKDIKINLEIDTTTAIDEVQGSESFIDDEERKKLEKFAESNLKKRIETTISKVQGEYDVDIFGFGAKLRENKIQVWNSVDDNWNEIFKHLKVNVKTSIHIKNSASLSKNIKEGD